MDINTKQNAEPTPHVEAQASTPQGQAPQAARNNQFEQNCLPFRPRSQRPGLKKTQSDLCIPGTGKAAKSIVPGQSVIKNDIGNKDLASTIEGLKRAPPPSSLEEVRNERAESKLLRRNFAKYIRERTRIRIARKEDAEKAEKDAAEKKARLQEADDKEKSVVQEGGSIH